MKTRKSSLVYDALINYNNEVIQAQKIIKESLRNPVFSQIKKDYQNKLEISLKESFFPRAPSYKRIALSPAVSGPYTTALSAIGRLEDLIKTIDPKVSEVGLRELGMLNAAINDAAEFIRFERAGDIERLNAQLKKAPTKEDRDMIVDEINSIIASDEKIEQNANVALSKAFLTLRELLEFFNAKKLEINSLISSATDAKQNLSKVYSTGVRSAEKLVQKAQKRAEKALADIELEGETEALEKRIKSEKGILGTLRGLFREGKLNINEGLMSDLLNPGNGKLDKYTSKVDAFIDEAIETCDDLVEEGNSMLEEDFYRLPQAGERSRLILEMIGLIKKFKCDLENIPWQLRQRMG